MILAQLNSTKLKLEFLKSDFKCINKDKNTNENFIVSRPFIQFQVQLKLVLKMRPLHDANTKSQVNFLVKSSKLMLDLVSELYSKNYGQAGGITTTSLFLERETPGLISRLALKVDIVCQMARLLASSLFCL